MRSLVVATRNQAKRHEFDRLLAPHGWRALGLSEIRFTDDLEEAGATYAENALAKASAVTAATGLVALGDDSGIEVVALGGWPGLRSARWMGPSATDGGRLSGLLAEVKRRCPEDRRVRYVAALALTRPGGEPVVSEAACEGLLVEPRGAGGFGYDPSFLSSDLGLTFAEASRSEKDRVSHRGLAVAGLVRWGALAGGGSLSGAAWPCRA